MLPLIRTLFDIALLRKGPESVPRSVVLLLMSLMLWGLAIVAYNTVFQTTNQVSFQREAFGFILGLTCYFSVLSLAQVPDRAIQTFTALIGCGAIMVLCFIAMVVTVGQLLGNLFVSMLVLSYLIWSISVEGHIIARAIDRALYIGVIIAFMIFVVQIGALEMVFPEPPES